MNRRPPIPVEPIPLDGDFQIDRDGFSANADEYHPPMRTAVVHHVVTAFLVAMVLSVGTWTYLTFRSSELFDAGFKLKSPLYAEPAAAAQLRRYQFALEVYFKLHEKYPPTLEDLVDARLLEASDLNYPPDKAAQFTYERVGDNYRLTLERTTVQIKVIEE